jgi:acylaminoacyl-peptidase
MYNDCHPLNTDAAYMDSAINTALWFIKYTSEDSE